MSTGDIPCLHCGEFHFGCCYPNSVCPEHVLLTAPVVRPCWPEVWMGLAKTLSRRSTCSRLQVGAVVVSEDNQRVLGVGYNGGPKGLSNDCQSLEPGQCGHLHAEVNALLKSDYTSVVPKIMYVTVQPCYVCAVAIVNANIKTVIYDQPYRLTDGLELLQKAGVEVFCRDGV